VTPPRRPRPAAYGFQSFDEVAWLVLTLACTFCESPNAAPYRPRIEAEMPTRGKAAALPENEATAPSTPAATTQRAHPNDHR
jgi:hypothetical protein